MLAVDLRVEDPGGHDDGLVAPGAESGEPELAVALHLGGVEGGPRHELAEEREGGIGGRGERLQRDGGAFDAGAGVELDAELLDGTGEVGRAPVGGALAQESGGDGGESGAGAVVCRTGAHRQHRVDDREIVPFDGPELEPVRQGAPVDIGRRHRRRGAGHRHLGAVEVLRVGRTHAEGEDGGQRHGGVSRGHGVVSVG